MTSIQSKTQGYKKYLFQILALFIAMVIGAAGIGVLASSRQSQLENVIETQKNELAREVEAHKKDIEKLKVYIDSLGVQIKKDSVLLINLNRKLEKQRTQTETKRREAAKLTPDEKKKFILDYYRSN